MGGQEEEEAGRQLGWQLGEDLEKEAENSAPLLTGCVGDVMESTQCWALLYIYIFNWSIIALHRCVSFCSTTKQISHKYTSIPSLLDFLPIRVITAHEVELPVLCSLFSLVIYFIVVVYSFSPV